MTCSRIHAWKRRDRARSRPTRCRRRCRDRSSRARTTAGRRPARPRSAPTTQDGRITAFVPTPSNRSTTSSTVTSARRAASTASFCTPMMPCDEHVAGAIGLLRVHDRDVGPERGHAGERFAGERAGDELDVRVDRREIRSPIAPKERGRHAAGAGSVRVGHRRVTVLFDLQRTRPRCSTASRSRCSDPTPGLPPQENTSFCAQPASDHLVVEQVGRHPDQREIRIRCRMISCPAANGIRCVNPSSATRSP